jgi:hypothetical protein
MPKLTQRVKRADNRIVKELRTAIHNGVPWRQSDTPMAGYADLIYLVTGAFYAVTNFIRSSDDLETAKELWWHLRDDILAEHIAREPGSRPWAWWALEDREPRRRLTERCTCRSWPRNTRISPPAHLSSYGTPSGCRCDYESEADYLLRHGLLTAAEGLAIRG